MTKSINPVKRLRYLNESERYDVFIDLFDDHTKESEATLAEIMSGDDLLLKMIFLRYFEEIPEPRAILWITSRFDDSNQIVRQAAHRCFLRNQFSGKMKSLMKFIDSSWADTAGFAIHTLAERGDVSVVPVLLNRLHTSDPALIKVLLKALRLVPETRSIAPILGILESKKFDDSSEVSVEALKTLSHLSRYARGVPARIFIKHATSPHQRMRQVALSALQSFPSKSVSETFLKSAIEDNDPAVQLRAIQALSLFPSQQWVKPLVEMTVSSNFGSHRLTAESTLKRFPKKTLKKGLMTLLDHANRFVQQRAALLLAETLGDDPAVRRRLFSLWAKAKSDGEKLALVEVLRELSGDDVLELILEEVKRSELLSYSATGVVIRFWTPKTNLRILALLKEASTHSFVKQALLDALANAGPLDNIKSDLFEWLKSALQDPTTNVRYLAVHVLAWYPPEQTVPLIFSLLKQETSDDVADASRHLLQKGCGGDPRLLLRLMLESEKPADALEKILPVFAQEKWNPRFVESMIDTLIRPPLDLLTRNAPIFITLLIRLFEERALELERIWPRLDSTPLQQSFLEKLAEAMADPARRFPPLPLLFLEKNLPNENQAPLLLVKLIGLNRKLDGIALLTKRLIHESELNTLTEGRAILRGLILGKSRD